MQAYFPGKRGPLAAPHVIRSTHPSLLHWSGDHSPYVNDPSISVIQDSLPGMDLSSEFVMWQLELDFGNGYAPAGEAIASSDSALLQSMDIPWETGACLEFPLPPTFTYEDF
ncbi:hypothetical protein ACEPAI_6926 [Sanghuangporus weigelae]